MKYILLVLSFISINCFGNIRISEAGKEFIKDMEKCVLTAYWDSDGYSIGYGHHGSDVKEGQKITKNIANKYFDDDIKAVENSVKRLINALPYKYKFSQGFIDGFISFVYNCGEGGAKASTFYKRLQKCRVKNGKMNESDLEYTLAGIKISRIICESHKIRRLKEYDMMK